ncbi:hypothetical protein [Streptomyces sp. SAI-170]|uniref:hypothetical protein n=1 Tax=Streptomyces sp. SAI-170 TaxID=3377729 RepID=UPI003C7D4BD3
MVSNAPPTSVQRAEQIRTLKVARAASARHLPAVLKAAAETAPRAAVNPQCLQRHCDLKAQVETVRARLAQDRPRAAAAATARKEAALEVENRMLLEQNAALQKTLHEVQNRLRALRAHELDARSLRDTQPVFGPVTGRVSLR